MIGIYRDSSVADKAHPVCFQGQLLPHEDGIEMKFGREPADERCRLLATSVKHALAEKDIFVPTSVALAVAKSLLAAVGSELHGA